MKKSVAIIEAPICHGQQEKGIEKTPEFFYKKQFHKLFKNYDLIRSETQNYHQLYKKALEAFQEYDLCVFLGGDHSMSFSTISAFSKTHSKKCVLWLDAHGDINTPKTSPSGNLHGMPLAGLLGLFEPQNIYPQHFSWFQGPYLSSSDVILVGLRSLDEGEKVFLKEKNIHCVSYETIKEKGLVPAVESKLEFINKDKHSLHLSFDIDAMDPKIAPATGTPVKEGLVLEDIKELMRFLKTQQQVVSMDLSEFNPFLGHSEDLQNQTYSVIEKSLKTYLSS